MEIVVKSENFNCERRTLRGADDACCCCLTSELDDAVDLCLTIDYSNIMSACFGIYIAQPPMYPCMICKECISHLTQAWDFLTKIEETQASLHKIAPLLSDIKDVEINKYYNDPSLDGSAPEDIVETQLFETLPIERQPSKKRRKCSRVTKKPKPPLPYELNKDDLACKLCNETFPLHRHLLRHMSVHFPNHICEVCAKSFVSKKILNNHMYRHTEKRMTCDVCNKSYKGRTNLKHHMKKHFGGEQSYRCPHCDEKFKSYYLRIKHLVNAHGDEPKKYRCKQCPKRYFQASSLRAHVRKVHLQERKHPCAVCAVAFFDRQTLNQHMLVHTGVKSFECSVCHKTYAREYTLKEHMKIHNNDKRFCCHVCNRRFTQKCTLKGHMRTHRNVDLKSMDIVEEMERGDR